MSFNPGGGGIANANDVAFSNVAGKDVLVYDGTIGKWSNQSGTQIPTSLQSADYTLALADAGTIVEMGSSSALTLTVPDDATVAFPVNTVIEVVQTGSGQLTIAGAAGVALRTPASLTARAQYSSIGLRKRSANVWLVSGDLT